MFKDGSASSSARKSRLAARLIVPAVLALTIISISNLIGTQARADASLLPGLVLEIDPDLQVVKASSTAPGIRVDPDGKIRSIEPSTDAARINTGGGRPSLVPHGLDNHAVIFNPAGGAGGWDNLILEGREADPLFAREKQPFTIAIVFKRAGQSFCEIMKLRSERDAHVNFGFFNGHDITIGQNDGPGVAQEKTASVEPGWQIVFLTYDGLRASLYHNGLRTAVTPIYTSGGFGQQGVKTFELLNGCDMQVAWIGLFDQSPAIRTLNAEAARLKAKFPSIVAQQTIVDGNTFTRNLGRFQGDPAASYFHTVNNPTTDPLPVDAAATPGHGLALAAGSRNAFRLVMGNGRPGANMTSDRSIRDRFFLNYMEGDLRKALGSPMDTGQSNNNTFAAVARHYPVGDPNDLHVMRPDGMHLRAVCSRQGTDCRPGHVFGAMVRLPFEWRPGTVIKVRYKSPKGDHSWAPIWMFTGQQVSPGPNGDPYRNFGKPDALYRASRKNFEIDWNDNFSRFKNGVATGYQIDFGTPDIYGVKWTHKPHGVYWANGDGWTYYDSSHHPEFERTPFDWSADFHDLVGNWRNDGSNLIDLFVDGKLVSSLYFEYPQDTYTDPVSGEKKTVAMHLIIGNQAVPGFSRGASVIKDNDGMKDGWTIVVQEISGWYGTIATPDRYRASPANGVR